MQPPAPRDAHSPAHRAQDPGQAGATSPGCTAIKGTNLPLAGHHAPNRCVAVLACLVLGATDATAQVLPAQDITAASGSATAGRFGSSTPIGSTTASRSWSGSAYLFDTTTCQQTARLRRSGVLLNDLAGSLVAITRTTRLVEAWKGDSSMPGSGATYSCDLQIPSLTVTNLAPAHTATFQVEGCTAGGLAMLVLSVTGRGPLAGPWGNGLLSRTIHVLGPLTDDVAGMASLDVAIPASATGVNLWFQALDLNAEVLSNGVSQTLM